MNTESTCHLGILLFLLVAGLLQVKEQEDHSNSSKHYL